MKPTMTLLKLKQVQLFDSFRNNLFISETFKKISFYIISMWVGENDYAQK